MNYGPQTTTIEQMLDQVKLITQPHDQAWFEAMAAALVAVQLTERQPIFNQLTIFNQLMARSTGFVHLGDALLAVLVADVIDQQTFTQLTAPWVQTFGEIIIDQQQGVTP